MQFTVSLPEHKYTQSFSMFQFKERFPECMITAALQSGDAIIELISPLVTPNVLLLLQRMIDEEIYPSVPLENAKAFEYLCVDVPGFTTVPEYPRFLQEFPHSIGLETDLDGIDFGIIHYILRNKYIKLFEYLTHRTDQYDLYVFIQIMDGTYSPIYEQMGLLILKKRRLNLQDQDQGAIVGSGYTTLLKEYLAITGRSSAMCAEYMYRPITRVFQNPEHYSEYMTMCAYLVQEAGFKPANIQLVEAIERGDTEFITSLCGNNYVFRRGQPLGALLMIALLNDQYSSLVAIILIGLEMDTIVNELKRQYQDHPTIHTPERTKMINTL